MIDIRPFDTLGAANHGWLDARHHFSFASYHNPDRMAWGRIRVWNDDTIAAKSGFPPHPHNDMEIVTFVRKGAISHKDSMGNEGRTAAGDVQVMSAGTGVTHAEYNLEDEETQLFQIWILTDKVGAKPSWDMREFPKASREGGFEVLASGDEAADTLHINADAQIAAAKLEQGQSATWQADPARHQYLVATGGRVRVNGQDANPRDGIAVTGEAAITVEALEDAELVLVDSR
ncbi:pirin family protein [Paraurantiacibacter namhicola]|uniref:Quercetin 2,3-dioxygenase n=1 Tax=Paraurantiacibacter namhicola TaxID=645517 RepID=A0A1C7D9G4_9SPHN|nr:pirin family protein [Paraurantiacibacter namhicola]ANU08129.1 Quercetin 2,3-dioxygenase [Paraurantiacibacter namhicola]